MENNKLKKTAKTEGFNKANSTASGFKSEPLKQMINTSSNQTSILEKKVSLTNNKKNTFSSLSLRSAASDSKSFLKKEALPVAKLPVASLPATLRGINSKGRISEIKSHFKKKPRLGEICNLNLTAIGPNGIAVDENSYGCLIITSYSELGKVKAKIVKIISKEGKPVISGVRSAPKYAIATILTEKKIAKRVCRWCRQN